MLITGSNIRISCIISEYLVLYRNVWVRLYSFAKLSLSHYALLCRSIPVVTRYHTGTKGSNVDFLALGDRAARFTFGIIFLYFSLLTSLTPRPPPPITSLTPPHTSHPHQTSLTPYSPSHLTPPPPRSPLTPHSPS